MIDSFLLTLPIYALPILGAAILPRQDGADSSNTATVDLSVKRGTPGHLASGFIYGIPDEGFGQSPDQIPDHFYTDMGFSGSYTRAGGAQIDAGGWIYGLDAYYARLNSTYQNYQVARKFGAGFVLLPHDIWGTDHANDSTVWPGDNGDWTDYYNFLDQLMSDLVANDMLESTVWDIWNEPDISIFWNRTQSQWVDLYVRTHERLRSNSAMDSVLISGPTLAFRPTDDNTWWTDWLSAIAGNNTIPDQYAYHLEGETTDPNNDLEYTNASLTALLDQYSLPQRQININEYANFDEQIPAGAAWWISRFERYNAYGLRGNWLGGCKLHDFMASLLGKPGAEDSTASCTEGDYYPNGEYQVYKYYALNMTGNRVNTTGSGDKIMDVYATIDDDMVRTLAGVRLQTGTWYLTIDSLSAAGLPESGNVSIQTYGFMDNGHFGEVDAPTDRGVASHSYSGDSVTFPVYQTADDRNTSWAFEFAVGN